MREVDLVVAAGSVTVLCGASGSGKSTLLRLLNGLVPHFHDGELTGAVTVAGLATACATLEDVGRCTGTVLQHPRRQFFTDGVEEEVAFASENAGVPQPALGQRVSEAVQAHRLEALVERRLSQLSGGQQQRVALAAATAHRPELLLLDEPSSNLSAEGVQALTAHLRRAKDAGTAVVVAEHRLHYLRGVADQVVVLRAGAVHARWEKERFGAVSDAELEAEGLRAAAAPPAPVLRSVTARGRSVAGSPTRAGDHAGATDLAAAGGHRRGLELRGIRCRRAGREVLHVEEAHLPAGRVTAVRGANGAGKTTLARVVTGLQRHRGQVLLDGRRLSRGERQRLSAVVMQDVQRQLFTDSVRAELALAATRPATPGARQDAPRVAGLLADLDLDALAERHPLSLSGGQQQRLVVAAARLAGEQVVVFDEPSSGVDRRHLHSVARVVRSVAADGAVVLLVTHDEELLRLTADVELTLEALT
nr:ABC transporter ATP-binding protein [Quadrisphaera sp. RL12-1S]